MGEKLLDRMRRAIRTRHYSYRTEKSYLGCARRYIIFHGKQHLSRLGKEEIEAFLSHLAVDRHVAPSTQNQALRHKAPKLPLRPNRQFIPIRICRVKPPAAQLEDCSTISPPDSNTTSTYVPVRRCRARPARCRWRCWRSFRTFSIADLAGFIHGLVLDCRAVLRPGVSAPACR